MKISLNPHTLSGFGPNVRGVIAANGDLYLENFSNGSIHNDILKILYDEDVFAGTLRRNWTVKTPDKTGFLTVQRYKDTPVICIGESNRALFKKAGYDEFIHIYRPFLEAAKLKNPGIEFVDKLVGIKAPFVGEGEVVFNGW